MSIKIEGNLQIDFEAYDPDKSSGKQPLFLFTANNVMAKIISKTAINWLKDMSNNGWKHWSSLSLIGPDRKQKVDYAKNVLGYTDFRATIRNKKIA